ncbi:Uncharacterised protein [Vibrio cholerae]|uniref:Uncharacterized protein n=1 Tax=Vibrio cholerae TaxID=666 RepID=A0A655PQK0_VIBCL|nr:Uncharacterised protein [Vibrio cholerae]CSA22728.1 Uncharacterised protein [Vibrio cholerae]CSC10743.1 Uncharacterised protein [Vibrio cholerae]CSC15239.1 Uncharacterised protein [Vibrio cholerae]CSD15957.1 Uncharacterised protein [Vibrio cholerae]
MGPALTMAERFQSDCLSNAMACCSAGTSSTRPSSILT